jgi:hypothetical protein
VSVNQLEADDSHGYTLSGKALTLGGGGLTIGASEGTAGMFRVNDPLTLGASQIWNVAAPPVAEGLFAQNVELHGALSGESNDLTVNMSGNAQLVVGAFPNFSSPPIVDDELGTVTINGVGNTSLVVVGEANLNSGNGHHLILNKVELETPRYDEAGHFKLNHTATGPITAEHSFLRLSESAVGPLTLVSSSLFPEGSLSVPSLSLDAGSSLLLQIKAEGGVAGTDYYQVTSTGNISLGSSRLELLSQPVEGKMLPFEGEGCVPPHVGQVYTLVSTTAVLNGTFANAANGAIVTAECSAAGLFIEGVNRTYSYRINYNTTSSPETVTATLVEAPSSGGGNGGASGRAEEAAAAKKRAEEEAAAKRRSEEIASANKKSEEETLAKVASLQRGERARKKRTKQSRGRHVHLQRSW